MLFLTCRNSTGRATGPRAVTVVTAHRHTVGWARAGFAKAAKNMIASLTRNMLAFRVTGRLPGPASRLAPPAGELSERLGS